MIPDFTLAQLKDLSLHAKKPLVICDVDEVVVHFTRAFEAYIAEDGLYLNTASFAINGNIRFSDGDKALPDSKVADIIDRFFRERTEFLEPIDGAIAALMDFSRDASVVMLTNLPHFARDQRIRNLQNLGLPFPCVTNSGPKGPAISHLAERTSGPVVFIDDSPGFISSCRDHADQVHLIHFLHDERFARHLEPFDFVSLTANSWQQAHPHITGLLAS
jgi:FMN phosphatase YigB (HAD superfamily)